MKIRRLTTIADEVVGFARATLFTLAKQHRCRMFRRYSSTESTLWDPNVAKSNHPSIKQFSWIVCLVITTFITSPEVFACTCSPLESIRGSSFNMLFLPFNPRVIYGDYAKYIAFAALRDNQAACTPEGS